MVSEAITVKVAENGRLSLPSRHRRMVGLEDGGVVVVRVEDGEIRIRPVQAVVEELQKVARRYFAGSGETVEHFLTERREEALRDE